MGWKSTIDMTRAEVAYKAVQDAMSVDWSEFTDDQLADLLEVMRGGDKHGHNYRVMPCTVKATTS